MMGRTTAKRGSTIGEIMTQAAAVQTLLQVGPGLSPEALERQAFEVFDGLRPGELVTLFLDWAPFALLARFQAERKGLFDWTPTRKGPDTWEVEVSRREGEPGALRTVNEALSWDHDRLDGLEARAFAARDHGDLVHAATLFSVFAFGLRRHIRFEEKVLFPEFETKAGFSSTMGPTEVMRVEHREILEILERIERAIGQGDSSVASLRQDLHAVLGDHNLKEENIVYPGTDRALTALERDALVARIQAM